MHALDWGDPRSLQTVQVGAQKKFVQSIEFLFPLSIHAVCSVASAKLEYKVKWMENVAIDHCLDSSWILVYRNLIDKGMEKVREREFIPSCLQIPLHTFSVRFSHRKKKIWSRISPVQFITFNLFSVCFECYDALAFMGIHATTTTTWHSDAISDNIDRMMDENEKINVWELEWKRIGMFINSIFTFTLQQIHWRGCRCFTQNKYVFNFFQAFANMLTGMLQLHSEVMWALLRLRWKQFIKKSLWNHQQNEEMCAFVIGKLWKIEKFTKAKFFAECAMAKPNCLKEKRVELRISNWMKNCRAEGCSLLSHCTISMFTCTIWLQICKPLTNGNSTWQHL